MQDPSRRPALISRSARAAASAWSARTVHERVQVGVRRNLPETFIDQVHRDTAPARICWLVSVSDGRDTVRKIEYALEK